MCYRTHIRSPVQSLAFEYDIRAGAGNMLVTAALEPALVCLFLALFSSSYLPFGECCAERDDNRGKAAAARGVSFCGQGRNPHSPR